ncbi:acyl transferase/acyl hydrolase/lysophospholipase [Podospora fimiseda]|uniref:[acyl-carrier-protein] S-malonyltransferase n=1 Tax=Podospora fimiseda TaxID=252190 RepID=A0AAN7BTN8_9PEZI|nr:acyl transferase/acyl hydrolase/lysophospholipase [Podospora fimiseda]
MTSGPLFYAPGLFFLVPLPNHRSFDSQEILPLSDEGTSLTPTPSSIGTGWSLANTLTTTTTTTTKIMTLHRGPCRLLALSRRSRPSALSNRFPSPIPPQLRNASSSTNNANARPKTAIFFPGQGVQKVGMLTPWIEAFPRTAKPIIEEIDHIVGERLSFIIQEGPPKHLNLTPYAQPAIMATSILILRILEKEFDFKVSERADFTLGHSLGEFAALISGGYFEFEDGLYMVQKRAEAFLEATRRAEEEYGGEYGMVAIVSEPGYLQPLIDAIDEFTGHSSAGAKSESAEDKSPIDQVLIANVNSKNQIVLSGNLDRIKTLVAHVRQFLGHDPRAVRLKSDSPFHSPIMKPAVGVLQRILAGKSRVKGKEHEDMVKWPGEVPCISNVSARPFESKEDLKDLLARQAVETVQWWDSIKYLDQEEKVRRWVGIGPGKVGRNLVGKEVGMRGKDTVKGGGVWAITDPSEIEEVLRGLEETENLVEETEE